MGLVAPLFASLCDSMDYSLPGELGAVGLVAPLFASLCDSMDYSLPGASVHGISWARILEWAAISFSRGSS